MSKIIIKKQEITKDNSSKNKTKITGTIKSIREMTVNFDKGKFKKFRVCLVDNNGDNFYGDINHDIYRTYFKDTCGMNDSTDLVGARATATMKTSRFTTKDGVPAEKLEIKYLELHDENDNVVPVPYEKQVARF